jgi:hypothetical protein
MRRHSRTLRFGAILALGATAAVTLAAAASAGPPFKGTFHFEGTDLIDDLCGVEGLNVAQDLSSTAASRRERRDRMVWSISSN